MTNADRIRAMTDEELAELLKPLCMNAVEMCKEEITYECLHYNDNVKCAECWLDLLKQDIVCNNADIVKQAIEEADEDDQEPED